MIERVQICRKEETRMKSNGKPTMNGKTSRYGWRREKRDGQQHGRWISLPAQ